MTTKKSKDFLPELCFLVFFNIIFGALYWSLDKKHCYTLVGRFYVITGIVYTFWLCILSVTQEGCEKFKVSMSYFIELVNFIMTMIFFIKLVYMANREHFCSEASVKILTYIFLAVVSLILLLILVNLIAKLINKVFNSRRHHAYDAVNQRV